MKKPLGYGLIAVLFAALFASCVPQKKMLYLKDGRPVLKDTNNSSEDFNSHVTASEIENQGTAIDYLGNKCTQLTWDGVTTRND